MNLEMRSDLMDARIKTKKCNGCLLVKPLSEFYRMVRGKSYRICYLCKVCSRIRVNKYRRTEDGHNKELKRSVAYYYAHRKHTLKQQVKQSIEKRKTPLGKLKYNAYQRVNYQKRIGNIIPKPCENCGSLPTHAHHDDYNKPLEVRWLCRTCHGIRHRTALLK